MNYENYNQISNFFKANGYCIIDALSSKNIDEIKKDILKKINNRLKIKKFDYLELNLNNLKNYHKFQKTDLIHRDLINNENRFININKSIQKKFLSNRLIDNILRKYWGHNKTKIKWLGSIFKNEIKDNAAGYRIARPLFINKSDAAGVHCDLHVGGKVCNDKKVLITAWVPLIGFNENYTLNIAPKSHLIDHPVQKINKQKKSISRVLNYKYLKKFKFIRPRLKKGQIIFFHPNLLHGASINKGKQTRFSIEVRFFNKLAINIFPNKLKENKNIN